MVKKDNETTNLDFRLGRIKRNVQQNTIEINDGIIQRKPKLHWYYGQEAEDFYFEISEYKEWLSWVYDWLGGIIDGEDRKTVECIKEGIELLGKNLRVDV